VNKIYRGLARPDSMPDDVTGTTLEKPWIACGGGIRHRRALASTCLVMDLRARGARNAFMSLPGAQEGNHPRRRQPAPARFTGTGIARQAINVRAPVRMRQRGGAA